MTSKHVKLLFVSTMLMIASVAKSQDSFSECSAAFLDNRMVVDEYSVRGKSVISGSADGRLTVCTAELGQNGGTPKEQIVFKIAIRHKETGTLVMFSDEAVKQVYIKDVLRKCSKGDHIVLLTTDSRYALPHNEILVL